MKNYRFWNDLDGNDTFTVEADSPEAAMHKALEALGWNGPCEADDDDDNEVDEVEEE